MKSESVSLEVFLSRQTDLARRKVLALLKDGRIKVNGNPVFDLNYGLNLKLDTIQIDSQRISKEMAKTVVYKFYKPKGMLSTCDDPNGRLCLASVLRQLPEAVVPVGRLDRDTTGLLLLTNDGDLAYRLTHPKFECSKRYAVTVDKVLTKAHAQRLLSGVILEDGPARFDTVEWVDLRSFRVSLSEGRNRIIRRMFAHLGYTVTKLHRLSVGPIQLGKLESGKVKRLTGPEFMSLVGQ
jgi:23S rRNA pseudouridine2605 synthase